MKTQKLTALITGATSGIGKSFASKLAERGYDLILTGRRQEELQKVTDYIVTTFGVNVETFIGDLSDAKCRKEISERIKSHGNIDFLVNNAGFGIDHSFYRIKLEDMRSMVMTHDMAALEFIHAVIPGMMNRRQGTIINVSSLGAFVPGFTRSLYLATKSFIHYFTKALSMEVYPYGIKLQSLCPGMTYSDFHMRARKDNVNGKLNTFNFMTPDHVVDISLKSLKYGNVICIPGFLNKLLVLIAKVLPTIVLRRLSRFRNEAPLVSLTSRMPEFVAA